MKYRIPPMLKGSGPQTLSGQDPVCVEHAFEMGEMQIYVVCHVYKARKKSIRPPTDSTPSTMPLATSRLTLS